jgi:hypothetical protein
MFFFFFKEFKITADNAIHMHTIVLPSPVTGKDKNKMFCCSRYKLLKYNSNFVFTKP